eukprot:g4397.t1
MRLCVHTLVSGLPLVNVGLMELISTPGRTTSGSMKTAGAAAGAVGGAGQRGRGRDDDRTRKYDHDAQRLELLSRSNCILRYVHRDLSLPRAVASPRKASLQQEDVLKSPATSPRSARLRSQARAHASDGLFLAVACGSHILVLSVGRGYEVFYRFGAAELSGKKSFFWIDAFDLSLTLRQVRLEATEIFPTQVFSGAGTTSLSERARDQYLNGLEKLDKLEGDRFFLSRVGEEEIYPADAEDIAGGDRPYSSQARRSSYAEFDFFASTTQSRGGRRRWFLSDWTSVTCPQAVPRRVFEGCAPVANLCAQGSYLVWTSVGPVATLWLAEIDQQTELLLKRIIAGVDFSPVRDVWFLGNRGGVEVDAGFGARLVTRTAEGKVVMRKILES